MNRNLVADNIERNQDSVTADGDLNLGSLRTLHEPDHAVLRHLHSRNVLIIHTHYPVSLHKAGLL